MKILLFGKDGQVGWELQRSLLPLGNVIAYNRFDANFENLNSIQNIIREIKPNIIVNAVAYTAVDKAETEEHLAKCINTDTVGIIAEEVQKIGGLFVHYSTDYVFDGKKNGAYIETDITAPLNVYGLTKRNGEKLIQEINCHHFIFRTSWVYASRGNNFIKTILRLAKERDELTIISDQVGAPTNASFIADVTALCLHKYILSEEFEFRNQLSGLYHLTASGETNWYDYAKWIVDKSLEMGTKLNITSECILPVSSHEKAQIAKRPSNSRLSTQKLSENFCVHFPSWKINCQHVLQEILA